MTRRRAHWGLFGGSFNPVHQGHVEPVRHVQQSLGLERVLYLPTASPPHKDDEALAPAAMRYAMVELALLDDDALVVSDLEMDPAQAPHYSIYTAERLCQRWPHVEFTWILGADSLLSFDTWHRWQELAAMVRVAAMVRPGWSLQQSGGTYLQRSRQSAGTSLEDSGSDCEDSTYDVELGGLSPALRAWIDSERVTLIENPGVDVSSTRIRQRLVSGGTERPAVLDALVADGWLPPRVARYLTKYPLYGPASGESPASPEHND